MLKYFLVVVVLLLARSTFADSVKRVTVTKIYRDKREIKKFKAQYLREHGEPCPVYCSTYYYGADGALTLHRRCGRCQVDHRCPLACGGADSAWNMQWLTDVENNEKGSRNCSLYCRKP